MAPTATPWTSGWLAWVRDERTEEERRGDQLCSLDGVEDEKTDETHLNLLQQLVEILRLVSLRPSSSCTSVLSPLLLINISDSLPISVLSSYVHCCTSDGSSVERESEGLSDEREMVEADGLEHEGVELILESKG